MVSILRCYAYKVKTFKQFSQNYSKFLTGALVQAHEILNHADWQYRPGLHRRRRHSRGRHRGQCDCGYRCKK